MRILALNQEATGPVEITEEVIKEHVGAHEEQEKESDLNCIYVLTQFGKKIEHAEYG